MVERMKTLLEKCKKLCEERGERWGSVDKYSSHTVYWKTDIAAVEALSRSSPIQFLTELKALAWCNGVEWMVVDQEHKPRAKLPRI